jgi:hypothetical protein
MTMMKLPRVLTAVCCVGLWATSTLAIDQPDRPLWGDLHVHSNFSFDSYSFGNTNLSPEDAYRFAKGETVTAHNGMAARLQTPLDFLLVADHAEYLGVFLGIESGDGLLAGSPIGQRWSNYFAAGTQAPISREYVKIIERQAPMENLPIGFQQNAWARLTDLAERHNQPGKFTTLLGYEWTSMVKGNNLHRVVVFRDGAEKVQKLKPFSALDGFDPEDLWHHLTRYEDQTGGKALAIPHNGNVSNGLMFAQKRLDGTALDADYIARRKRFERLYEVTQVKGDAETHPALSPQDEFADFETWDQGNLRMLPKHPDMLAAEYARPALKAGLGLQAKYGQNPFQFGLVGSTDTHTALSTADDNNFFGKFVDSEPSPERTATSLGGRLWENWRLSASGYTAVWAKENSRAAIFDALYRREVYASSGPRINLRFFAGWQLSAEDLKTGLVEAGYKKGVPMGGELFAQALEGKSETDKLGFLIGAMKDPVGQNLSRVQIIKGWRDEAGNLHEQITDLIPERSGGVPEAQVFWQDPNFDARQGAFYYIRVLEEESDRWTAHDARNFSISLKKDIVTKTRERVYSSPIWFHPLGVSHE